MSGEEILLSPQKEIGKVGSVEEIGLSDGTILFNLGHAHDIRTRIPRLFNSDFSKIYEVGDGPGKFAIVFDIQGFEGSKYMHDDTMLDLLLRTSYAQLATDALTAQGFREVSSMSSEIAARYRSTNSGVIERFMHNAEVLGEFAERVEDAQLLRKSNKRYVNNIREFAVMAKQLVER